MKFLAAASLLIATAALSAAAPPSSRNYIPSSLRQDFTGQGTFHRQGLFREQQRALASSRKADDISAQPRPPCLFKKFWNSLFPPRTSKKPDTSRIAL